MPGCLVKIAGMASSSKGRRASSSKQSSGGKARVITARRKDTLPRKGNVSNKKAHSLKETETSASRAKTTRAAGRASGKRKKPAAMKPEVEALAFVETEVELEVEASAIVEETTILEAPCALPVEAVTRAALPSPAPAARAPHHGKRALVTIVSQLLSALRRWTRVR
jgi:hypothetical protein